MRRRGRNTLKLGDHNAISDISGFKHKASEMRKLSGTQKGLLVHKSEWNPAHPQLKIRAKEDKQNVSNVRDRTTDKFEDPPTADEL
jgi:hypothetical protein